MRVCPTCFALYGPDHTHCPKDGAATEDPVSVLIGKSLGSYQVRSLIGEGGMGVVYAGEHTTIGRRVALKVLRPELSLRDDIVERFVQEARAVNTISHGNIVNIYDFGKTPFGSFYIVMEYLDGRNLRNLLDDEGAQPLELVRKVIDGVAAALSAAHAKGFIHRDVKPENIMLVDRAGSTGIKLLDFGIAKLLHSDGSTAPSTYTGSALGTPQYMSPEQLEDVAYDHRADIYSLGAVAYEMLTGQLPYPGKSHAEVRQLQLTRTPAPPSVVRPEAPVSRRLDAAVLWALSPDPATRCGRMEDFYSHFEAGCEEAALVPAAPQPRAHRPRTVVVVVVALVAMLVGGVGVYLMLPDDSGTATKPVDSGAKKLKVLTTAEARKVALERVGKALRSPEASKRILVTDLLRQRREAPKALEEQLLLVFNTDDHPTVRQNLASILGRMGARAAIPRLRELLAEAPQRKKTGWSYAEALFRLGEEEGKRRLHRDLRALQAEKGANIKVIPILPFIGRLGDRAARKALGAHIEGVIDPGRQSMLRGYLAEMGDAKAKEKLIHAATTLDWGARVNAARALVRVDPTLAQRTLRDALGRTTGDERFTAATELASVFKDASSAKVLVEFLKPPDQDRMKRMRAVVALGHLDPLSLGLLVKTLDDEDRGVGLAAAVALLR